MIIGKKKKYWLTKTDMVTKALPFGVNGAISMKPGWKKSSTSPGFVSLESKLK